MKHIAKRFLMSLVLLVSIASSAFSQKGFSLEDAFLYYKFYPNDIYNINWMNDGSFYTTLEQDQQNGSEIIAKYKITNGEKVDEVINSANLKSPLTHESIHIDDYSFNSDETKILIKTEEEPIYRRSTRAFYYIYDLQSQELYTIDATKKQMYATLSPYGKNVAYVIENNLYVKNLETQEVRQITNDGEFNKIINGATDWVYEEEFSMSKAFKWSPDGSMIAYLRFDESEVKEYNLQIWGNLYPIDYRFKYPKAGEKNSVVTIHVFNLDTNKTTQIDTGVETDIYLPRIYWVPKKNSLSFIKLNRLQNNLSLYHADPNTGKANLILNEASDTFVDLDFTDDLTYFSDGESFIKTSEKSGFKHIYHYDIDGHLISQLTDGDWEVDQFLGVDEKNNTLYFTSTEVSPIERHLYSIRLDGKDKKELAKTSGVHSIDFSPDFQYYIDRFSSSVIPLTVELCHHNGKVVRVLEDNKSLNQRAKESGFTKKEFFEFSSSDGKKLHGYMMKPKDFDANKKYPVLMFVYGGPGQQTVMNEWGGFNYWWHQYMIQQGYIVVSVDNRGTDGRGTEFKHSTYGIMGKLEVDDQIRVAKYLAEQTYVDRNRIGIWGWSYGGYMSSLALFVGNDIFKTAIAVAPVTNWRFYDTIYTERYQGLPQTNPSGYDDYSPINHVEKLKGHYLIIHGTGDDNVHMQNSIEMIDALIHAGKQFDMFFYPNRNHGIYGENTRFHLYEMMSTFLLKNL